MKRFICSVMASVVALTAFVSVPTAAAEGKTDSAAQSVEDKLPSPSNYVKSSTATTVTLSWDKVDGAAAYKVYMFDRVLGEFTAYKTVKKTTITIKGLEKNTKYQFKVQTLTGSKGKYTAQKRSGAISVTTKKNDLPTAPSKNYTGWGKGSDSKYYFKKGKLCSGLQKVGKDYYFFTNDGYLTGWLNNKEIYYYFDKTGKMVINKKLTIGGNSYEFDADGKTLWYSTTVVPKAQYTISTEKPDLSLFTSDEPRSNTKVVGMMLTNNGTKNLIIDDLGLLTDSEYDNFDRILTLIDQDTAEPIDKLVIKPGETKYVFYLTLPDATWYDSKSTITWYANYDDVSYVFYTSNYYGSYDFALHYNLDI